MKDTDRGVEPSIQSRFTFAPIEEFAKILDSAPDPPGYYQARLDLAHLSLMSGFDELICLDQRERYAVKTAVRWLNALRVYLDVIVVVYEVQRKRRTRELLLVWNPLKKGFEDLSCEHWVSNYGASGCAMMSRTSSARSAMPPRNAAKISAGRAPRRNARDASNRTFKEHLHV